jgi:hypothetical protein
VAIATPKEHAENLLKGRQMQYQVKNTKSKNKNEKGKDRQASQTEKILLVIWILL